MLCGGTFGLEKQPKATTVNELIYIVEILHLHIGANYSSKFIIIKSVDISEFDYPISYLILLSR